MIRCLASGDITRAVPLLADLLGLDPISLSKEVCKASIRCLIVAAFRSWADVTVDASFITNLSLCIFLRIVKPFPENSFQVVSDNPYAFPRKRWLQRTSRLPALVIRRGDNLRNAGTSPDRL